MALLSLALPIAGPLRTGLLIVGLAGASLFFGDAMITPAISVLSAVEISLTNARLIGICLSALILASTSGHRSVLRPQPW